MSDRPWFISFLPLAAAISSVLLRQLIDIAERRWTKWKSHRKLTENRGIRK